MANAATTSNSNPVGVPASTNATVASVNLSIPGTTAHQVFVIGEFSADCSKCASDFVVGDIQVDGNTFLNTQVNNLNGAIGALIVVSGIVRVAPGAHRFDLRAYTRAANLSAHHRSLSVIDLN